MSDIERWTIEGSNFSPDRLTRVSGPVLGPRAQARVVLQSGYDGLAEQHRRAVKAVDDATQVILDALAILQPKQARELMESPAYKSFAAHNKEVVGRDR